MLLRTRFDPWQHLRTATTPGKSAPSVMDCRAFTRGTLAAAAMATLPACKPSTQAATMAAIPAQVDAIGLAGTPITLAAADIKELRAAMRGSLLLATDEGYDAARRIWNPAFDRHPALIDRCANAQDVVHAVNFASALMPRRSSIAPSPTMRVQVMTVASGIALPRRNSAKNGITIARLMPAMNPAYIARPPIVGVGTACTVRSFGW